MVEDDDLDAAVADGVLTQAQLDALRTFVTSRRASAERADDERFRFMRGFNDFFFAVGIVLFGAGITFFAGTSAFKNILAAAVIWALAEFLVRRMRLVLPGILLVSLFAFFAFRLAQFNWAGLAHFTGLPLRLTPGFPTRPNPVLDSFEPIAIAVKALAAALAATLFYLRFQLPFALLVIAGCLVLFLSMLFGPVLFPDTSAYPLILLLCGLGVFTVAMYYDLSDRTRTTRLADCAFWLHLLAAPLIVHSLIRLLLSGPAGADASAGPFGLSMTTASAVTIFVIVALLTMVAILIDRRALLVSALIYLGIAIGYALTSAIRAGTDSDVSVFFATLVILGATVLILGAGWQPLRRVFLRLVPTAFVNRLPPAAYPA
jgi:hypothetical protein